MEILEIRIQITIVYGFQNLYKIILKRKPTCKVDRNVDSLKPMLTSILIKKNKCLFVCPCLFQLNSFSKNVKLKYIQ